MNETHTGYVYILRKMHRTQWNSRNTRIINIFSSENRIKDLITNSFYRSRKIKLFYIHNEVKFDIWMLLIATISL